jgi:hypothetical protein
MDCNIKIKEQNQGNVFVASSCMIACVNSSYSHPYYLSTNELRSIILFVVGFSIYFPVFLFEITIEFGLFTFYASCFFINVWWSGDLDYVVDLLWEEHGDFFGFEHDAKANGLNVLLI